MSQPFSESSSNIARYLEDQQAKGQDLMPDEIHFLQRVQAARNPGDGERVANGGFNEGANANDGTNDHDDSELSTRIMRSGLTRVGQLVRTPPQNLLVNDISFLEEKMRDPRYQAIWQRHRQRHQGQQQQQQQGQPQRPQQQRVAQRNVFSSVEETTAELRNRPRQQQEQHRRSQQQQQAQRNMFGSPEEVTAELHEVIEKQKEHLLAAVECEVRIKELWWYRHAMEEEEEDKKGGDKDKGNQRAQVN